MPRSPKSSPPMPVRRSRGGSRLSFQYVSGSLIQLADSEPVAFPGPLQRTGSPAPHLLTAFIQQCQLRSQQPRMSAGDWNNLGYAYASLAPPNLQGAGSAFARAQALTRDEELLVIIRHNLRAVASAVSKATGPVTNSELPRRPPKVKLPLPDIAYNRQSHLEGQLPDWMARPTRPGAKKPKTSTPKATVSGRAKKPGSKSPRK